MITNEIKELLVMGFYCHWKKTAVCLVIVAFIGLAKTGCTPINKMMGLEDNHPLEEAIEDLIKLKTGIDVDLSETPEK